MSNLLIAVVALVAIGLALWRLLAPFDGVTVSQATVGERTPATVYRPAGEGAAPTVLIAHGFAGSQQLMQPFALTLARNGYIAVTFDFLGHGEHPLPLTGDITRVEGATRSLLDQMADVARFARGLPRSDGRLGLLGHSMASDIIVRFAQQTPEPIVGTVAVSMFAPTVSAETPENLLVIVGGLEPQALLNAAKRAVALKPGVEEPSPGEIYGSFSDGSARGWRIADGVEHIGVLYSQESLTAARDWLNRSFGRKSRAGAVVWGPWILLLVLAAAAFARPAFTLLPAVREAPTGAGIGWRRAWPVVVIPAVATPLVLWLLPTNFLPLLVGDYLAAHFGLYGLLTALALWYVGRGRDIAAPTPPLPWARFALAAAAVAAYAILAVGVPIDRFFISFWPIPERLPLIAALFAGTLPFFLADEWLTRGPQHARGAYPATKAAFLVSLMAAAGLDLEQLFFLFIIVPVMVLFFVVFGLFSRWSYKATGHPAVAGVANALIFAWAIAVTFPMVQQ
ncbi:alpha/beta hydrolase [Rhodovibrio sodomensis]|uniref:Alpha/beta hydrolase n=1 Tax=Rhodovibrio sodomensis TaxID=1088 RepID=A0ABS1DIE2_9PROT|nr:alpha/beta fold hydrolase [Rhodovibrio sodomensis]MBK1669604.1 alpha/beta hydrolase [Rhodovibrio sodomensis]